MECPSCRKCNQFRIVSVEENEDGTQDFTVQCEICHTLYVLRGCYPKHIEMPGGTPLEHDPDTVTFPVTFKYGSLTEGQ